MPLRSNSNDLVRLGTLALVAFFGTKVLGIFDEGPGKGVPKPPGPPPPTTNEAPTFTEIELRGMCDVIADALGAYATEDEALAVNTILRCRNTADVEHLVFQFGKRFLWRRMSYFTLQQLLHEYVSDADLSRLNNGLRAKGINYTF